MRDSLYLVFNERGVTEMTKKRPASGSGFYAIEVKVEIPDEFFLRPIPLVHLKMTEDMIPNINPAVTIVEPYESLTGTLLEEACREGKTVDAESWEIGVRKHLKP